MNGNLGPLFWGAGAGSLLLGVPYMILSLYAIYCSEVNWRLVRILTGVIAAFGTASVGAIVMWWGGGLPWWLSSFFVLLGASIAAATALALEPANLKRARAAKESYETRKRQGQ